MINYRNITIAELKEFALENPNYSLGDLLYSVLQPVALHNGKHSVNWLRDISDEQFFTFVEKAREIEKEEKETVTEVEIITILKLQ